MTTKRTPSPETLRKRAYNAFVDAEAKLKKAESRRELTDTGARAAIEAAEARMVKADRAVRAAEDAMESAKAECARLGCPGFGPEPGGAAS